MNGLVLAFKELATCSHMTVTPCDEGREEGRTRDGRNRGRRDLIQLLVAKVRRGFEEEAVMCERRLEGWESRVSQKQGGRYGEAEGSVWAKMGEQDLHVATHGHGSLTSPWAPSCSPTVPKI